MVCGFIWGSMDGKQHVHLLNREIVTSTKDNGGLGIRSMRRMNLALMAKLGWRLCWEKDSLWSHFVGSKYNRSMVTPDCFVKKHKSSNAW